VARKPASRGRARRPGGTPRARPKGIYAHARYREKTQDIIRSAGEVFRRKGYRGATMEEIAAQLRMTKGNLYYYFANKEEILYTCHRRSLEIGFKALETARESNKPADERLRMLLRDYIRGLTDELRGSVILLEEGALSREHFRKIVRLRDTYERGLRELIEDGIKEGRFTDATPKIEGFVILGAVNWISKWYSPNGELSSEAIADMFAERLVRGLLRATAP
jgi:AcrR family transcriptional regulator